MAERVGDEVRDAAVERIGPHVDDEPPDRLAAAIPLVVVGGPNGEGEPARERQEVVPRALNPRAAGEEREQAEQAQAGAHGGGQKGEGERRASAGGGGDIRERRRHRDEFGPPGSEYEPVHVGTRVGGKP